MNQPAISPQNWQALLQLELRRGSDRTRLVPIRRYGPLSVQRPFYPEQDCCHVYLLHPPGGVVGGDSIELQIDLDEGAQGLLTTPGAGKFYLSAAETAQVRQSLRLACNAQLEFLPQENIYFPGARVNAKTTVRANANAAFMLWEKHCFGRPANQEVFDRGQLVTEIELYSDERLIFCEKQRIDAKELRRSSGLRDYPVCGSFIALGNPIDTETLRSLQQLDTDSGAYGLTQPQPGLIVARCMARSTGDINRYFVKLWTLLRPLILNRAPSHPRIWST